MTYLLLDGGDEDGQDMGNGTEEQQPDPVVDAQNIGDAMGEKIGEGEDAQAQPL